jgi:hypothetical protein
MTITSAAAELKCLQRLLQSSLGNFSSPRGAEIVGSAVCFAFRSSYRWVRQ